MFHRYAPEQPISFGDARLDLRFNNLLKRMTACKSTVLRQLANGWPEEIAYGRLLRNKKMQFATLLDRCCSESIQSSVDRHVLVLQDTTQLVYRPDRDGRVGLGRVGSGHASGFSVHASVAVDASDGGCLGLSDLQCWNHTGDRPRGSAKNKTPTHDKEIYRWVVSAQNSAKRLSKASGITMVGDREADFYQLLMDVPKTGIELLVRSSQDRLLAEHDCKLFEWTDQLEVQDEYYVKLPKTDKRSPHKALLQVRFGKIALKRPKTFWDKIAPQSINITVVDVRESTSTVEPKQQPVHWRLITTHEVQQPEKARQIIEWYCQRWWIEQLFRSLKTQGLNIEASQLHDFDRLAKLAAMATTAAVKAIQLTKARDGVTKQALQDHYSQPERKLLDQLNGTLQGNTVKQQNPHHNDTLAYAAWIIARLGGWKGYASQRPPGPVTMLNGIKRYQSIKEGWELMQEDMYMP